MQNLWIDLHCHVLPGVDDGAQSSQEAQAMLAMAKRLGIGEIVATPHVRQPNQDLSPVQEAMAALKPVAQAMGIALRQGYEVNLSALQGANWEALPALRMEGSGWLLLEFPPDNWPFNWDRILYDLQREGLELLIAHPERYRPLQRDFERARVMVEMGCRLQIDAQSVGRLWGGEEMRLIRRLLGEGAVYALASDAHTARDYLQLGRAARYLKRRYGSEMLTWEERA